MEQKCSIAVLSIALTPISLWTVSWSEEIRKNSVGYISFFFVATFFLLLISCFGFFIHPNISGVEL